MATLSTSWTCSSCTFENVIDVQVCEVCGSAPKGWWICSLCKSANPDSKADKCSMCEHERSTDTKICHKCNAENRRADNICQGCASVLDEDIDIVQIEEEISKYNRVEKNSPVQNIIKEKFIDQVQDQDVIMKNGVESVQIQQEEEVVVEEVENDVEDEPEQRSKFFGIFGGGKSKGKRTSGTKRTSRNNTNRHNNYTIKTSRRSTKNQNNNKNAEDSGDTTMFKDVKDILNKEANEHDRIAREEEEVKDLAKIYEFICGLSNTENENISSQHLHSMMKYVPPRKNEEQKSNDKECTECQVCNSKFHPEECKRVQMKEYCSHAMICKDCFTQYLQLKIKDQDVVPWLRCPAAECFQPIHPDLLIETLQQKELNSFARTFLSKILVRNPNWIKCNNDKECQYGFVVLKDQTKDAKKKCALCGHSQTVSRNPIKSDQGFQELIKSGTLRLCPKCEFPTMKDKGLCNVMQCGQCGIWWNWRTYEFGTNSRDLKNRARAEGTLWEQGELQYQQMLQNQNPEEFKKLLERNGIRYDPNYIRGT